jgi:E3 ubiquitin-protein ligase MARCH6
LELSSLILGVETLKTPQSRTVQLAWLVTDAICQSMFGRYDNRATRARVPGNDRVELLPLTSGRREGMFIPLDQKGAPRNEADELRLLRQDRAARRAGRNPLKDYTVVNLPDYWRTRIHVLLGVGLMSTSVLVATLFFVPLAVGRLGSSYFFTAPVFDGYNWVSLTVYAYR